MNKSLSTSIALVLAAALLMAGCDEDSSSPAGDTNGTAETIGDTGGETSEDMRTDESTDSTLDESSDSTSEPADDTGETAPDAVDELEVEETGPFLTLVVEGSLEDHSPDDGLAAQTPSPYFYGLQRVEMLREEGDPEPVVVFDYSPNYVMVDMAGRTEVGKIPISRIPEGTYSHFRIVLSLVDCEVEAFLHEVPVLDTHRTDIHIVYALSDIDTEELQMSQGDAVANATVYGQPVSIPSHWDVVYPNPSPYAWSESIGGKTYVTFRFMPGMEITHSIEEDVTQVVRYYIYNAFRWRDQDLEEYEVDTWDITVSTPPSAEPVLRFGANHFETYTEE